ncbi:hypothetical protein CK203_017181 [Vitis vinifera]|uniref:Uncharacterized protein n=1 Tax=Vitis vinifera TaxID=29760 RepID=A0A438JZI7_VITVI|nr:hypothetical protein CK203_017181 [Vitis vinifera]
MKVIRAHFGIGLWKASREAWDEVNLQTTILVRNRVSRALLEATECVEVILETFQKLICILWKPTTGSFYLFSILYWEQESNTSTHIVLCQHGSRWWWTCLIDWTCLPVETAATSAAIPFLDGLETPPRLDTHLKKNVVPIEIDNHLYVWDHHLTTIVTGVKYILQFLHGTPEQPLIYPSYFLMMVTIKFRTLLQRAGLELMDMMAVYQEGAYERLCR